MSGKTLSAAPALFTVGSRLGRFWQLNFSQRTRSFFPDVEWRKRRRGETRDSVCRWAGVFLIYHSRGRGTGKFGFALEHATTLPFTSLTQIITRCFFDFREYAMSDTSARSGHKFCQLNEFKSAQSLYYGAKFVVYSGQVCFFQSPICVGFLKSSFVRSINVRSNRCCLESENKKQFCGIK